ncbi:MAG TPA: ribosome small subunit-dependent GTPase A [Gemmatimonadaceae bacterium]|nr:ribosome small subunit-dependent GTPase A [Gemmatimonadaceae bacterium]
MTAETMRAVVASGTGGVWRVLADNGEQHDAVMRGRLKKVDTGRRADGSIRRDTVAAAAERIKLAVGDNVMLEREQTDHAWAIAQILPRTSRLARRAPGGGRGERIIVANVDQVIVMFAAAKPEPHPRMLDRFLVIAGANDLAARIIINKVELVGEDAARSRFAPYEKAGYPVHYTSVKQHLGIEAVAAELHGRNSVVTGPSGVGKSSLLNELFPGLGLRVAEVSESVNKGRHTTVGAFLHRLPGPGGGAVLDTPGLREIGLWEFPIEELDACYPELRGFREECRFADCAHTVEPGCAVREAVKDGQVSETRYDSYLRLRAEIEAEERYD